ncbi:MAG: hypothetical protein M1820_001559 [Bogoriella megaspora]|nr:MAG: hypothetical protein M1820_001559 [Bogoriella megaspora]
MAAEALVTATERPPITEPPLPAWLEDKDVIIIRPYYPEGVQYTITTGGSNYIGFIDDCTVLKYPHSPGNLSPLEHEAKIYELIGRHPRVVEFKGMTEWGIQLQNARNGSVGMYLLEHSTSPEEKLKWSTQAAEAVASIHSKGVVHCDINASNLVLNEDLNVQLCDFQSKALAPDGSTLLDAGVYENPKYRLPSVASEDETNYKTDIFALGTTLYHIMQGHPPFPDLDQFEDEIAIQEHYQSGNLPLLNEKKVEEIVHKCWKAEYPSADIVAAELRELCEHFEVRE